MANPKTQLDITTVGDASGVEKIDAALLKTKADAEALAATPPPQITDTSAPLYGPAAPVGGNTAQIELNALKAQSAQAQALINSEETESLALANAAGAAELRKNEIIATRQAIVSTELEATAELAAGRTAEAAILEGEVALLTEQLRLQRTLNLSAEEALVAARANLAAQAQIAAALVEQEAALAAQKATQAGGLFDGAVLGRVKQEVITIGREIGTGSVRAQSLGSLLGALGPIIGVATLAGFGLKAAIEAATSAWEEQIKKVQDLGAEADKLNASDDKLILNATTKAEKDATRLTLLQQLVAQEESIVGKTGDERDLIQQTIDRLKLKLDYFEQLAGRKKTEISDDEKLDQNAVAQQAHLAALVELKAQEKGLEQDLAAARDAAKNETISDNVEQQRRVVFLEENLQATQTAIDAEKNRLTILRAGVDAINDQTRAKKNAEADDQQTRDNTNLKNDLADLRSIAEIESKIGQIKIDFSADGLPKIQAMVAQSENLDNALSTIKDQALQTFGVVVPQSGQLSIAALEAAQKATGPLKQGLLDIAAAALKAEGDIKTMTSDLTNQKDALEKKIVPDKPNPKNPYGSKYNSEAERQTDLDNQAQLDAINKRLSDIGKNQKATDDVTTTGVEKAATTITQQSDDLQKKLDDRNQKATDEATKNTAAAATKVSASAAATKTGFDAVQTHLNDMADSFVSGLSGLADGQSNLKSYIDLKIAFVLSRIPLTPAGK